MKIRVKEFVKLSLDKMTKIALAGTDRSQLDLYCVAPGQSQKAHTHDAQDKIYYVLCLRLQRGGRCGGPASEYGGYVTRPAPRGRVTAAGGPFMLASL
jgi:hypothetical protein